MKINGIINGGKSEPLKKVWVKQTLNGIYREELIGETYKTDEQIRKDCPARLRKYLVIEVA